MSDPIKKLFIARVHGFCNGVRRALECVELLQKKYSGKRPIYVYNEIVHNTFVVNNLKSKGVSFVRSLDEVPDNCTLVWSAHGVSPELEKAAAARALEVKDATCPLVKKLHDKAVFHCQNNDLVIFAGHRNHPETVGVLGCGNIFCVSDLDDCNDLPELAAQQKAVLLTQTTWCRSDVELIAAELQKRYPALEQLSDICYATGERQQAVIDLVKNHCIELLLVIGSPHSSNSQRLCETARKAGADAQLIDDPSVISDMALDSVQRIGITAGASAPETLLLQAIEILQKKHRFTLDEE